MGRARVHVHAKAANLPPITKKARRQNRWRVKRKLCMVATRTQNPPEVAELTEKEELRAFSLQRYSVWYVN